RMKCRNQWVTRTRRPKKIANAKLHLIGGFVGECNGEDLLRPYVAIFNQVRHAIRDYPRLAAARAGENKDRALGTLHVVELFGIEKLREIHTLYGATKRHKKHKSSCEFCASLRLLHCNTLRKIARLVDIAATPHSAVIGEQLKRYHFEDRKQIFIRRRN